MFWTFLAIDLFGNINGSPLELNWLPRAVQRTEVAHYQKDCEVCRMLKVYLRETRISRSVTFGASFPGLNVLTDSCKYSGV